MKTKATGGTILSYATESTFAIVNGDRVQVFFGRKAYDTGSTLTRDTWYQISITYLPKLGENGSSLSITTIKI